MVVLGNGGLEEKSNMGFGCMGITAFYGPAMADEEAVALLQGVHAAGSRHFNSAEIYKTGNPFQTEDDAATYNEATLGKFFKTVPRDSFTVSTKYITLCHEGKSDYDTVKAALLRALARLDLPYVDVYICRSFPHGEATVREWMETAKRLVEEGLVKHVGCSEISAANLRLAHSVHPVELVEMEWSVMTRNIEEEIVPTCKELNIGILAYSPLARSLLVVPTDAERPTEGFRAGHPRFSEENFDSNKKVVAEVHALAAKKNVTPAQLCLAWLLHKARDLKVSVLPIPGTTKLANARANVEAAKVVLEPEDMSALETVAARTAGPRGNEHYLKGAFESQLK